MLGGGARQTALRAESQKLYGLERRPCLCAVPSSDNHLHWQPQIMDVSMLICLSIPSKYPWQPRTRSKCIHHNMCVHTVRYPCIVTEFRLYRSFHTRDSNELFWPNFSWYHILNIHCQPHWGICRLQRLHDTCKTVSFRVLQLQTTMHLLDTPHWYTRVGTSAAHSTTNIMLLTT